MAYTGQITRLPIGNDGMNGSENLDLMAPDQLEDAKNVSFAFGGITKEGGTSALNAAALGAPSPIIGGWDWWPDTSLQRTIVLCSNGAAYRDTGAGTFATTLTTGMSWTTTTVPVFVESGKEAAASNKKLYIFTGTDQVQVLSGDGVTIGAIGANRPADWAASYPTCGANHLGRLWGAGNANDPHRLYYSTITDTEDFSGAGSGTVAVSPGEGTKIVAMASFYGLLLVWKFPRGLYAVDTTDASSSNWIVRRISGSIGGASPRCWCFMDDSSGVKVLFMSPDGNFHTAQTTDAYGSISTQTISSRVYFTTWAANNLTLSALTTVQAAYYPLRREAHFTARATGSTSYDRRIVWDFNRVTETGQILPRLRYNNFPNARSLWVYEDASHTVRLSAGGDDGVVYRLDNPTKSHAGAAYTANFKSAALDLDWLDPANALGHRRKNGRFLELVVLPKGDFNLVVKGYWDDNLGYTQNFNMGGSGTALGSFILDTHALSGGAIRREKHRLFGDGFRFSIEGTNSVAGEDFAISKFYLYFDLGSERVEPA